MLYFIPKASDGIEEIDYDLNDSHDEACWSPEKRKPKRKKRRKIVGRSTLRSRILGNSSVVLSTLSGAGSKAFVDAVCRDPTRNDSEFDGEFVFIDTRLFYLYLAHALSNSCHHR